MIATMNQIHPTSFSGCCAGTTVPFEAIHQPGCYICNWSGNLLRVPEDGIAAGNAPAVSFIGNQSLFVTMISNNPYITVTKARLTAANFDVSVNF
ncbi:MAG: hypothetical protein HY287_08450 [Planctomycetes bacterium]|nr:hypothetical protein [Planctomycetota bacterium]